MTEVYTIPFGKHRGESIQRVPLSYVKWLANTVDLSDEGLRDAAKAELARRGTKTPTIEVQGHAIDRASLNCRTHWHETSNEGEGLWSWLNRMAETALKFGTKEKGGTIWYLGLRFVFADDTEWPVLKTVMPRKKPQLDEGGVGTIEPPAGSMAEATLDNEIAGDHEYRDRTPDDAFAERQDPYGVGSDDD